jgi:hypothetical protein
MGEYVGAEQLLVELWVRSRIATVNAALEEIDLGLSARVYSEAAPKGAVFPVIIFQCQDPPRDVRGVGTFTVMVDTLYLVKAVAQVDDYAELAPIASLLHEALTTSTGGSVGTGTVLTSVREQQFSMPEFEEGEQWRHLGGMYRIQAQG